MFSIHPRLMAANMLPPSNVQLKLPMPSGLWHIDNTEIGHTENLRRV